MLVKYRWPNYLLSFLENPKDKSNIPLNNKGKLNPTEEQMSLDLFMA